MLGVETALTVTLDPVVVHVLSVVERTIKGYVPEEIPEKVALV